MRLVNHTLSFLATILFVTIGIWAILFFSQLLNQVKVSLDEGLSDYKIVIIDNLKNDSLIKQNAEFGEKKYLVRQVDEEYALKVVDTYKDTILYSHLRQKNYKARLLTTAFVTSNGNYYEMKVLSQELNRSKLINKFIVSLFWMFLFLLISTIMVNTLALKKTWKPFYQVLDYLNDFRLDKRYQKRQMESTNIREFVMLDESVKNLIDTNIEIFESQKQFIENVSHEMQTPLTIGLHKLELLAENDGLSENQLQNIGEIIESFKRLSGLNKSLLLLSKIQNKQFPAEDNIDFDIIFSNTINILSDLIDFWEIKLDYRKKSKFIYKMNKDLSEIMVMNLVKNAIIHNHRNGEIQIKMNAFGFTIENSGTNEPIPPDRLFQRFSKNTDNKSSTGLGLSIVKAVSMVSNLKIEYKFNNRHIFKINSSV